MASSEFPLHLLQSAEQIQLLNDIDKLRSDGVQYHNISLPQLVVCGDQSSGKSSVLEALSNVNFPVGTGTRTRFVTELALRRSPDRRASAKIIPGRDPSADRQQRLARLADFKPSHVDLAGVPALVEEARCAMGLSEDRAISDDVLRLEITGPDLPHLTLVDLPGIIADAKDTKDIKLVEDMVKVYMENPRSIILAIVSAKNDKQNQKVLRLARQFDPDGDRTVGVITKPDALNNYRGSVAERTYLDMAKNQDPVSKLRLGWHVVRNPDYHEKQEDSTYNRTDKETELFSQEPWNELSKWQLGIHSLRNELMKHLFNQICSQLPRVVEDIEWEEFKCEQEIKDLGEVRDSAKDQRKYLIGISRRFEQLIGAGLEGHWTLDPIFSAENMRPRAQIRNVNDEFEKTMKAKGHTFEFKPPILDKPPEGFNFGGFNPGISSRDHLVGKVNKILKSGRGQELPGMFDPILVSDIFRDQSQNWSHLARQHVDEVWQITNRFLQSLLFKVAPARTQTAEAVLNEIVSDEMRSRKRALDAKIEELLLPYVRNLPFCTSSRMTASLKQIDLEVTNEEQAESRNPQPTNLADTEIDVDACTMLLRYSQAYYNVARDTFFDNVITLGIENCLLAGLNSIFSSDMILDMDDCELAKLAGESERTSSDRKYAEEKRRILKQSLETCRIHMSRRLILQKDSQRGLTQDLTSLSLSSASTAPGFSLRGASIKPAVVPTNRRDTAAESRPPLGDSAKQDFGLVTKPSSDVGSQDSEFGSSLFRATTPTNIFSSGAGLLSNVASAGLSGGQQSGLFTTPLEDANRPALSSNIPGQNLVPRRQSPSRVPDTTSRTQAETTTSQTPSSNSEALPLAARNNSCDGNARPLQNGGVLDDQEGRVRAICNSLSHVDQSNKQQEVNGVVLYQSCIRALFAGNEQKSFEELRLEDRKILEDSEIPRLMKKRNPQLLGKPLTSSEIEAWCRDIMAGKDPNAKRTECPTQ